MTDMHLDKCLIEDFCEFIGNVWAMTRQLIFLETLNMNLQEIIMIFFSSGWFFCCFFFVINRMKCVYL